MWANVVANYMYYLATFSVRNSRNYLTYEISTDSDILYPYAAFLRNKNYFSFFFEN